jgi:hypothetical protein
MSDNNPVEKRRYHLFLSHSSKNKPIANQIYTWLYETAGIRVWYDSESIDGGDNFIPNLEQGISSSRGLLLLHSRESSESFWVKQEVQAALNHQSQFPKFRIIILAMDETPTTGFLSQLHSISIPGGVLTLEGCTKLLRSIYPGAIRLDEDENRDLYVSLGWRDNEQAYARFVCRQVINAHYRLVGDSKDQEHFNLQERYKNMSDDSRVASIMESCGGLLAIMPYRNEQENEKFGFTSKYILREIDWAIQLRLPFVIVKDPSVQLSKTHRTAAKSITDIPIDADFRTLSRSLLDKTVEAINSNFLKVPQNDHYAFFAADISEDRAARNRAIKEIVQRVSAMPCRFGENIHSQGDLYGVIIERIRNAFFMMADISGLRVNVLIECGIAIGAKVPIYYVQQQETERHRPPVMLGSVEPRVYRDEVELIGAIHRIAYPYRRRILNHELT